mmetsp:Transcript_114653/g.278387  ORF Transcript_114653/g.278387 Transcript_114653/m.278387 type:complete len:236 (-) Transcript_114653:561-1268(-)
MPASLHGTCSNRWSAAAQLLSGVGSGSLPRAVLEVAGVELGAIRQGAVLTIPVEGNATSMGHCPVFSWHSEPIADLYARVLWEGAVGEEDGLSHDPDQDAADDDHADVHGQSRLQEVPDAERLCHIHGLGQDRGEGRRGRRDHEREGAGHRGRKQQGQGVYEVVQGTVGQNHHADGCARHAAQELRAERGEADDHKRPHEGGHLKDVSAEGHADDDIEPRVLEAPCQRERTAHQQ